VKVHHKATKDTKKEESKPQMNVDGHNTLIVIAGLDPAIHLSSVSTLLRKTGSPGRARR